jgi:voltage-gated potassium channel
MRQYEICLDVLMNFDTGLRYCFVMDVYSDYEEYMVNSKQKEKIGPFQILLLALSIYVLLALCVVVVIPISASTHSILIHVDNAVCIVFLYDFFHRLAVSKNKIQFLRWGWIDFVSSIPLLPIFRVGRAIRVVRVLRLLRGFRSVKMIGSILFANRAKGTLATAVFFCTLLTIFSSVAILQVENRPDSNIRGPEDALWWSVVTITTVGYGDLFPVTSEGRLIGAGLMICGVGLFAVLSGAFATWFTNTPQSEKESEEIDLNTAQLSDLIKEVRELRNEIRHSVSG